MIKPSDTLVLLAVSESDPPWTIRSLAERIGVPHAKVQRGLVRLADADIYDASRQRLINGNAVEFVTHALRYLQPLREGPVGRGVPTAWGAAPLRDLLAVAPENLPVWPTARGAIRGATVVPLDPALPALTESWPAVVELAALADGLRLGDARTRDAAATLLRERLGRRR